jgi:hypothetical protein
MIRLWHGCCIKNGQLGKIEIKKVESKKMKNMKNTIAAIAMLALVGFGTMTANAGIIIAKEGKTAEEPCKVSDPSVISTVTGYLLEGIIIAKTGIIIAKEGIIIAKEDTCSTTSGKTAEGIIIA